MPTNQSIDLEQATFRILSDLDAKSSANTVAVTDATYVLSGNERVVFADATSNAITVSLPDPALYPGVAFRVWKVDASGNAVTVDVDTAENIDGAATDSLPTQYAHQIYVSNGTQYYTGGA